MKQRAFDDLQERHPQHFESSPHETEVSGLDPLELINLMITSSMFSVLSLKILLCSKASVFKG